MQKGLEKTTNRNCFNLVSVKYGSKVWRSMHIHCTVHHRKI